MKAAAPSTEDPVPAEHPGSTFRDFITHPKEVVKSISRRHLGADLLAGLTVAAVAVPQAIAYASITDLPAQYGLYTAAVGAVVGALWGSSRYLSTGPVNALSLLVLPVLLGVGAPGSPQFLLSASLLAVLVGLWDMALARLHFGALVTLASRPVLLGFTAGAAVHIGVGQLKHLFGVQVAATPELYKTVAAVASTVGAIHQETLLVGVGALALLLVFKRLGPRFPAALLAIAAAGLALHWLGLDGQVKVVGQIPRALPTPTWLAVDVELLDLQMVRGLIVGSMAVAALGLMEAVASAQSLARISGQRLDTNQEFFGQGLANLAVGLLSGYPCSGSFTRSALAQQSGARTPLASVISGVTIMASMLLLAPLARMIPRSAIAGVLLVVAWGMVDQAGIRRVIRTSRSDVAAMVLTFGATLMLPLDFAVLAGVVFSLAWFVVRSSLPRVFPVVPDPTFRHLVHDPELPVCPQLGVLTIRGPLFFGAVYHIEEELRHNHEVHPGQVHLVLRMHGVDLCDLSGVEMLEATVKTYRELGGDVFLVRPRSPVLEVLSHSGFLDDTLSRRNILEPEDAIEYLFEEVLDPMVCTYECVHRVFAECQALEKHLYDELYHPCPARFRHHDLHAAPQTFQQLIQVPDSLLIDVREPPEFSRGHLAGARLLPLRLLVEETPKLPRQRPILLVCRSGRRTSRALHLLESQGFTQLHGLRGGMLAWRAAGLPVASEEPGVQPTIWYPE